MANETKVVITAETAQAESALISLNRGVQSTAKEFLSLSGIAGLLSVGAIGAFVKKSIDAADELAVLAEKTGASVEALAGLKFAAEQNDTSLTGVATAAGKFSRLLSDQPELFRKYGITATDTTGALMQLSDILSTMPDVHDRNNLAFKLMGKTYEDMIPIMNLGSDALARQVEEGQKIYPITTANANAARQFNDDLAKMQAQLGGVGMTIGSDVIPALTWLADNGIKPLIGGIKILAIEFAYSMQAIGLGIEYATSPSKWGKQGTAEFEARLDELKRIAEESKTEIATSMEGIGAAPAPVSAPKATGSGKLLLKELSPQTNSDKDEKAAASHQAQIDAAVAREQAKYDRMHELAISFGASETERVSWKLAFDLESMDKEHQANITKYGRNTELDIAYETARLERMQMAEAEAAAISAKTAQREEEDRQKKIRADMSIANFSELLRQKDYSGAMGMAEKLSAGMATKHRAMFEVNKAASLASTTIKGYQAVVDAYEHGTMWGGPLGGAAEAAVAAAYVAAQLDAISSTSFSGGGGGGVSSAGGVPSQATSPGIPVSQQPVQQKEQPVQVNIYNTGNVMTTDFINDTIIPQIKDSISNSDVLIIDPRSRQAQVLGAA